MTGDPPAPTGFFRRRWRAFKRWGVAHFSGIDPREAWGYWVWGFFALIVAIPEIWAAKWPKSAPFPTISGTVGELEYWHPVVALVVIAVIVLSAYSALRYPPDRTGVLPKVVDGKEEGGLLGDPVLPYRTQEGGRLTAATTPLPEIGAGAYFAFALVVIGIGTTIAALRTDINDEYAVGRTLYGLTALLWVVIPSLLAWPKKGRDVPFPRLFETLRSIERRLRILALAVTAGLAILLIHLVLYPFPEIIPDIKDLHDQYQKQGPRHRPPHTKPPSPTAT
jgi:hypothetical protein